MKSFSLVLLFTLFASASYAQIIPQPQNPFQVGDPGATCQANIQKMEVQEHKDRVTALKLARQDLLSDKSVNQNKANHYLDRISNVALAEGDQRNTIFSQDGIVKAFKSYDRDALTNYLAILDTYADLLKKDKTLPAGKSTLHKAAVTYLLTLKTTDPNDPKKEVPRFSQVEAEEYVATLVDRENCFLTPEAKTAQ